MVEALIALAGVIVGVVIRGTFEHRSWLRDARKAAYAECLHAIDTTTSASYSYIGASETLLDARDDHNRDERTFKTTYEHAQAAWGVYRKAFDDLDGRDAVVELLGSKEAAEIAFAMKGQLALMAAHHFVGGEPDIPSASATQVERWTEDADSRDANRRRFLDIARRDLRTDRIHIRGRSLPQQLRSRRDSAGTPVE